MSKRREVIYEYFIHRKREDQNDEGITTLEVSEQLKFQRTNVSKDLNELVRLGKLMKTKTRPVKYYLVEASKTARLDVEGQVTADAFERKELPVEHQHFFAQEDAFTHLIGYRGSLKNAVEQAKASILYPPKGLDCLITGPTGSGKTYFAHLMFQYAKERQMVEASKKLVVFNCADYAHNPELLMSYLFGYVEGAFTGAEKERSGLIDEANEGILFLDEVHRLPPEGQEMIFYLMDHGLYNRLGEVGKNRQANVRVIGATTENPSSALLATFLRRIPIHIQLPSFEKRTPQEKMELIQMMVAQEATRIKRRISLTEEVIRALIGSVTFGNIGQLKSSVQLVCARGFLNHMQHEQIDLSLADLPEGIRAGLRSLTSRREMSMGLAGYLPNQLIVDPDQELSNPYSDSYELPYNLYDIIGNKAAFLRSDGVDQETINHFISTDINIHLQSFYKDHGFSFSTENKLSEFVDAKVIAVTHQIYQHVQEHLPVHAQQNFIYGMSLHIASFLKKFELGEERSIHSNIRLMVSDYPLEFQLAQEVQQLIADFFRIELPEDETYYLAALLISLRHSPSDGKIGLIIAAHGNSTASSMAEVARQLLELEQVFALDMPLDMSPKIAFAKMKEMVLQADQGSGVLLLVDMGSLAHFDEKLESETGVTVRTLDMVSTPIVLEAVRKAETLGLTLDDLVESLQGFQGYSLLKEIQAAQAPAIVDRPQAILAICASGEGTAQYLKEQLEHALEDKGITHVEVLTESVLSIARRIPEIQKDYQLLAVTGVMNPQIDVPFLSLEAFFQADLGELLTNLLLGEALPEEVPLESLEAREVCLSYLEENILFLNPAKVIDVLWEAATSLCDHWYGKKKQWHFQIHFTMHVAGVLERLLLRQPLSGTKEEKAQVQRHPHYTVLKEGLHEIETAFHLEFPEIELYYILGMLDTQGETQ
ncbi:sigma-54-dependent transcriptional regulator [Enterococcus sp. LJL98]